MIVIKPIQAVIYILIVSIFTISIMPEFPNNYFRLVFLVFAFLTGMYVGKTVRDKIYLIFPVYLGYLLYILFIY